MYGKAGINLLKNKLLLEYVLINQRAEEPTISVQNVRSLKGLRCLHFVNKE